jgi:hypothetical protein
MSKEGMVNNVKAPLSVLWLPLSLCTVVCATAMIAIGQEGKEWQMMPRHHHQCRCLILLLSTVVPAAAVIAIAQEGEEWPKMLRHCRPHSHCLLWLRFVVCAVSIVAIV